MSGFIHIQTISDIFKLFRLEDVVHHPLVAVIDFSKVTEHISDGTKISAGHYTVLFKDFNTSVKYGRKIVDFQDGSLICMAPNQVIEMDDDTESTEGMAGWGLFFHPDLIRGTALNDRMKDYSFFSYETSEALHLSEKEKQILLDCMLKIQTELQENIDVHSQAIIVSTIELLLNYCSRFYGRQFITRKSSNNNVVAQVEKILTAHFTGNATGEKKLITVKDLAEQVHLSPGYLSDLLKKETGKNTQDHIHIHLIEAAKNILLSTNMPVGEIAYSLGFDYPQYFNKLFKQKTGKTPLEFRSMN
ncbi:helix-turn-helix transcriptional regulator [Chitinophaga sp. G-6-1-13]|uniref:Helix-turn-helix transcriptional regulator n=1 Tax=Chitinophaga fulva TaxID=2728842 RepID=A0A848GR90_9BACT|nr:response regulator transcription factor [Chitinophaga fulva]NML40041.1 helix-turn-helix transcriptional regulator [Chitinophaga fulva]